MKRISFQGERGAYSEAASVSFFGNEVNVIPCSTFADALKNAENDTSDYSVLPVENSLEGSVGESNDLLLSTNLKAVSEIYHRIHHCLIGTSKIFAAFLLAIHAILFLFKSLIIFTLPAVS